MRGKIKVIALVDQHENNFQKLYEYMKRAQLAERKVEVLKSLILLTHDVVSSVAMNDVALKQWNQFTKEFHDEREFLK